jgi:hypothetical protein
MGALLLLGQRDQAWKVPNECVGAPQCGRFYGGRTRGASLSAKMRIGNIEINQQIA